MEIEEEKIRVCTISVAVWIRVGHRLGKTANIFDKVEKWISSQLSGSFVPSCQTDANAIKNILAPDLKHF